ncbi:archaetidylserine decarboxylase [Enterococcus sp. 5H]|uniref:archaetidylserine decarboxylase n=1 Tax=Enterococcus sp. 5H TaxID=1229490 RepID=UPI00230427F9|nr:archaetidylserine decarboxylase [Enterococcus sp. 5H]MDA9470472.1 Phosphatidylserine decarboxylase [Enterococcus sp. 5H]
MQEGFKTIKVSETSSKALRFLYKNKFGRFLLKGLIQPPITKMAGVYLNSTLSKVWINFFIKKNNLEMSEYELVKYSSFNDFFKREIKPEARPLLEDTTVLTAPCDGKVKVYPINEKAVFQIKRSEYSLAELLGSEGLAKEWQNGSAVIFRLTPDDYHHYYFIDEGTILSHQKISGIFHTVQPIAIHNEPVFSRNSREVTVIDTKNFGKIIQIEVGALMVGKIKNLKYEGNCQRFEKKGWFEFGGSTVLLLFQAGSVLLDSELTRNTENKQETIVKFGQALGKIASE